MLTRKRIVFIGYGLPSGEVAHFVLAACAIASGVNGMLRGITERAFPYTDLSKVDELIEQYSPLPTNVKTLDPVTLQELQTPSSKIILNGGISFSTSTQVVFASPQTSNPLLRPSPNSFPPLHLPIPREILLSWRKFNG